MTADGEKVRSGVVIVADIGAEGAGGGAGGAGGVGVVGCAGAVGVPEGGVPPGPAGGSGADGGAAPPPPQPYKDTAAQRAIEEVRRSRTVFIVDPAVAS